MFPVLETARLRLRELTLEDVPAIFRCFSNEAVTSYYGQEPFVDTQQAKQAIKQFAKNFEQKRGIHWGIERKDSNEVIGTIGFHLWSAAHHRAEIGYEIHPDYWRQGYIKEAVQKVIAYGFQDMNLNRIGAVVFLENEASSQLLMKLGFQQEGILRDYMYQNGQAYDTFIYSLLKRKNNATFLF
ncbi:GNAT family N-acetyltransferase [Lysinibacillus fusiformis]|uniref:GNAT family N-acetyltransferase n=1 Tax=Lysinibacillus fusiformis TaxID=28031 RepID=UPI002EBB0147|nr:GNAT family N-acetyltransferase [Lysinibacillus fusiformis]